MPISVNHRNVPLNRKWHKNNTIQLTFTCSKSTIETLENQVKYA